MISRSYSLPAVAERFKYTRGMKEFWKYQLRLKSEEINRQNCANLLLFEQYLTVFAPLAA
jgi:hypothetical protein